MRHSQIFIFISFVFCNQLFAKPVVLDFHYEERELAPFFMGVGHAPPEDHPGIFIEMLQALDQAIPELEMRFHRAPWKRCLQRLETGEADAVIASYRPVREDIGVYPSVRNQLDGDLAISTAKYCIFRNKKARFKWDGMRFNAGTDVTLAVPSGYSVTAMLKDHGIKTIAARSSDQAMYLANVQKVSGAVTYCETGREYITSQLFAQSNLIEEPHLLEEKYGYFLFSHQFYQQHPQLSQRIWQQLKHIRNQSFQGLLLDYGHPKHLASKSHSE